MTTETLDLARLVKLMRQMAHDMRGPLGVLSATADMFVQGGYGELTPKQERAVNRMKRASHRSLVLLDDFMTYVKAEARQLPLDIDSFDPKSLLLNLQETVLPETKAKDLTVRLIDSDGLPPILFGDATLIRRVMLALLWNAIGTPRRANSSAWWWSRCCLLRRTVGGTITVTFLSASVLV